MFYQASIWAFIWFFVLDSPFIDTPWKKAAAEEKAEEERAKQKLALHTAQRAKDSGDSEAETLETAQGESAEEEEGVDIPDEIPEDAFFIPLGFARKKPKAFYKKTDPEWQSFVAFSKDKKRAQFIRSRYLTSGRGC